MDRDKLTPTEAYIQQEEGFRAKPYRCTSGALTIDRHVAEAEEHAKAYARVLGIPYDQPIRRR